MSGPERYQFGPFRVNLAERECLRGEEPVALSGKAFDLLQVFVRNPGRTLSKAELMEALWPDTAVEESNLTQTVFLLRKVLGEDFIQTVPRLGYKFAVAVSPVDLPVPASPQGRPWAMITIAAVILAVAATAAAVWMNPQKKMSVLTPFSFEPGRSAYPIWSPDGKAVAFGHRLSEADVLQLHVRYLDSHASMQLTHGDEDATPVAWTKTGRIVFQSASKPAGLWTISQAGGEAEPLLAARNSRSTSHVSSDGSAAASYDIGEDGNWGVWISAPPGAPVKPYVPAVPPVRAMLNVPVVHFSPDGKQILLARQAEEEEFWLMPYPPDDSHPPRRVLLNLPPHRFTPTLDWMPDNRRVVLAMGADLTQLYVADTVSGEFSLLSRGTANQLRPAVSPLGGRLVFQDSGVDQDLVSIDVTNAEVKPLRVTDRSEDLPAWAAKAAALVYVTDQGGQPEIRLHKPGEEDRPIVTVRDFPEGVTLAFMNPVLSPDGTRVAYGRVQGRGAAAMWLSNTEGGPPVKVLKDGVSGQPGSWSPDGAWIVFLRFPGGNASADLYKVKVSGLGEPVLVKSGIKRSGSGIMPAWSPAGDWIFNDDGGPRLISPDGKQERAMGSGKVLACGFSRTGDRLYCMRQERPNAPGVFYWVPVSGGPETVIGTFAPGNRPQPRTAPSLRLTANPNGSQLTYSISKTTANLWLLDGIE